MTPEEQLQLDKDIARARRLRAAAQSPTPPTQPAAVEETPGTDWLRVGAQTLGGGLGGIAALPVAVATGAPTLGLGALASEAAGVGLGSAIGGQIYDRAAEYFGGAKPQRLADVLGTIGGDVAMGAVTAPGGRALGEALRMGGNTVAPYVRALTEKLPGSTAKARRYAKGLTDRAKTEGNRQADFYAEYPDIAAKRAAEGTRLRAATEAQVAAQEAAGVKIGDMPATQALRNEMAPIINWKVMSAREPSKEILRLHEDVADRIFRKQVPLTKAEAIEASQNGIPVISSGDDYFRVVEPDFKSVDDTRRFLGKVYKGEMEGYAALKGVEQKELYKALDAIEDEYASAFRPQQTAYASRTKQLEARGGKGKAGAGRAEALERGHATEVLKIESAAKESAEKGAEAAIAYLGKLARTGKISTGEYEAALVEFRGADFSKPAAVRAAIKKWTKRAALGGAVAVGAGPVARYILP